MPDKATILNVDDYEPGRYSRSRVLRGAGFTVFEASTGAEALEIVHRERPQLVVLDVNLPDMSGFEVCRRIKDDPETRHTLVLHLSATSVGLESKLAALEGGGDGYLSEPVDPQELVASVGALLRLKRTEEALRHANVTLETLVESSPLAVVTLDRDGIVQRWNRAAERIFGWTAAEAIGRRSPAVPPERRAEFEAMFRQALNGEPQTGFEIEQMRKDGLRVPVSISSAALRDAVGRVVGAMTLLEDITERKHATLELARLYEAAQQAATAKDDFLATLSHELRTPFNAMLGWVQMLRRGEVAPDRYAHALEVIERNASAQLRLIEDILDVSSIVSGKLQLQPEILDLVPLARAAAEGMDPVARTRQVTLTVTLASEPLYIEADGSRIQQVIMNLLSNAVKFTPAEGRVELSVDRDGDRARIVVCDTGTGIDPAFIPHVFERFRQADSTRSRAHGGLGLGLAIASHLVEAHGGTIAAESDGAGQGSCFTVLLPLVKDETRAVPPPGLDTRADEALGGTALLVVDDDRDSRELLGQLLARKGATVYTARSADEAVAILTDGKASIVIADIGMPGEDGLSMVSRVRASLQGRPLYAIAVSGYTSVNDRQQAQRAGFDEYLAKPIDAASLLAAVTRGANITRG